MRANLMLGVAAIAARAPGAEISNGPSGVLFYLAGYAATNLAAFSTVIAISNRIGSDEIDDFAGMARRAPYIAGVLAFAMVSLIGLPPTVGFVAKIYLFGAAIDTGLGWLAVAGVVNSVISAYYYLRVVKVMYLSTARRRSAVGVGGSAIRLAVMSAFAVTLFFGVYPTPLLDLARAASSVLLS